MRKKLIIVGTGDYAEVAFYFLSQVEEYIIEGFSEEAEFVRKNAFKDLPIFKFEDLTTLFDPAATMMLVAVGPNKVNTVRERLFKEVKAKGFSCVKYIHPEAYVWNESAIGENSFIFPKCIVEPFAYVGNNCALWSGSILAHHSVIEDHCFLAPGCTVSGRVTVRNNSFLGINSTIRDNIVIGEKCIIGGGAVIKKNTEAYGVYSATRTSLLNSKSLDTKV